MKSGVKTRQLIADEYGITRKTLYNWLKKEGIELHNRLITPREQQVIYDRLGHPFAIRSFA
ncbi:helix-turn-helix domain-containing protein [Pontibacter arcticus]|uniref:Uncharacterized protein n=1 Tax=Pontibacter arcticus TaxID=2080288 RepID=A0A364REL4_9BACT|nr:helix-turn-helix domain-containing protein [Pontibacter arcticus]RAU82729.1 hypothetical protein DP923_05585 [Pontibacter arcticus]